MNAFAKYLIRILALLCFCGGPLFLLDQQKQQAQNDDSNNNNDDPVSPTLFAIYFVPVAFALFGAMSLIDDETPNRFDKAVVALGTFGIIVLVGEAIYALLAIHNGSDATKATTAGGVHTDDTGLVQFGCVVTFVTFAIYLYLLHHRYYMVALGAPQYGRVPPHQQDTVRVAPTSRASYADDTTAGEVGVV